MSIQVEVEIEGHQHLPIGASQFENIREGGPKVKKIL